MKRKFPNTDQKIEAEKIQFLLAYKDELNLIQSDINLLIQRRNELINNLKITLLGATDDEINDLFDKCTPGDEYFKSFEYSMGKQHDGFYDGITIDQNDPKQPVFKDADDLDENSVDAELQKYDMRFLDWRIFN